MVFINSSSASGVANTATYSVSRRAMNFNGTSTTGTSRSGRTRRRIPVLQQMIAPAARRATPALADQEQPLSNPTRDDSVAQKGNARGFATMTANNALQTVVSGQTLKISRNVVRWIRKSE